MTTIVFGFDRGRERGFHPPCIQVTSHSTLPQSCTLNNSKRDESTKNIVSLAAVETQAHITYNIHKEPPRTQRFETFADAYHGGPAGRRKSTGAAPSYRGRNVEASRPVWETEVRLVPQLFGGKRTKKNYTKYTSAGRKCMISTAQRPNSKTTQLRLHRLLSHFLEAHERSLASWRRDLSEN